MEGNIGRRFDGRFGGIGSVVTKDEVSSCRAMVLVDGYIG